MFACICDRLPARSLTLGTMSFLAIYLGLGPPLEKGAGRWGDEVEDRFRAGLEVHASAFRLYMKLHEDIVS